MGTDTAREIVDDSECGRLNKETWAGVSQEKKGGGKEDERATRVGVTEKKTLKTEGWTE